MAELLSNQDFKSVCHKRRSGLSTFKEGHVLPGINSGSVTPWLRITVIIMAMVAMWVHWFHPHESDLRSPGTGRNAGFGT